MFRILQYTVPKEFDGKTIKDVLRKQYNMSTRLISKIKTTDNVLLNGVSRFTNAPIKEGDNIVIRIPEEQTQKIVPKKLEFHMVYEDEDLCVVNKPANMATHPSFTHYDTTLANALLYYWLENGEEHTFRPINRLDANTTGLMIVAKNQYSNNELSVQLKNKNIKRNYYAIVRGGFSESYGFVEEPIGREEGSIIKRAIVADGKYAYTQYRVIQNMNGMSLLSLDLKTGRTHQIRVHMAHIGHPLIADTLYDEMADNRLISRCALHCCHIEFVHPITKEPMGFDMDMPPDMKQLVKSDK